MAIPNMGIKRRNQQSEKVKIIFDTGLLNTLIRYIRCEYVKNIDIANVRKLIQNVDIETYKNEPDIYDRLKVLDILLDNIITSAVQDTDMLRMGVQDKYPDGVHVIDDITLTKNTLTPAECAKMCKGVNERVQTIAVDRAKNDIIETMNEINARQFSDTYGEFIHKLRTQLMALVGELQIHDNEQGLLRSFAFSMNDAVAIMNRVVDKAKKPASILQTGIRQLNAILSPGFQSGRMYTFIGGSGRFKSGTLLNMADQIRRFNPQIPAYENGLRKCILFITLENSIEETIERIYDMYSGLNADLRSTDVNEIVDTLREDGAFSFTNSSGIDIYFKYAGNLEINTSQIHVYMKDLLDEGYQPIAIVLDYIKRIDSVHNNNGDERLRMSFVSKELKAIAQYYEIPLITAMQLNREGNSIIDAAMRENKQDVARFIGSSLIGNAWDIIEDSDWVGFINLELQKSTNQLFLTFKRLKIRSKQVSNAVDYFNHPFVNDKNIRLATDVDKDQTLSIISLATDLESIEEKESSNASTSPRMRRMSIDEYRGNTHNRVLDAIDRIA